MTAEPTTAPDDATDDATARPSVRSFKRRSGRIRPGQQAALDTLLDRYGVAAAGVDDVGPGAGSRPVGAPIDPAGLFGRVAPLVLEIGFGMGEAALAMAAADPDRDLLAVDVYRPGAGAVVRDAHRLGLTNLRVLVGDAVEVLRDRLGPGSLDEVRVYFPDPWPKARHHKRRLVTADFARLVATRLRPGGLLHLATDWAPYADQMRAVLAAEPLLTPTAAAFDVPRPAARPVTRFERQGLTRGHQVTDLLARRVGTP